MVPWVGVIVAFAGRTHLLFGYKPPTIAEKMAHNQLMNWQNGDFLAVLLVTLVCLVDA